MSWGQYSGIAKIVPPIGWVRSVPPITKGSLANIRIKKPIQQNMIGGAGQFRQTNVEKLKNKPLTLEQWFTKSRHRNFAGPGPKDLDRTLDRDSEQARAQRAAEEQIRNETRLAKKLKREDIERKKRERPESESLRLENEMNGDLLGDAAMETDRQISSQATRDLRGGSHGHREVADLIEVVPTLKLTSATSRQSSPDPLAVTPEQESASNWYDDFDPAHDWLPDATSLADYTPEACATMERKFWKNIGLGEPTWYGADLQGKRLRLALFRFCIQLSVLKVPSSRTPRRLGMSLIYLICSIAYIGLCLVSISPIFTSDFGEQRLHGMSRM